MSVTATNCIKKLASSRAPLPSPAQLTATLAVVNSVIDNVLDLPLDDDLLQRLRQRCCVMERKLAAKERGDEKRAPLFPSLFQNGKLKAYMKENTVDPWVGTNFERYAFMNPKQKGESGERFLTAMAQAGGHDVQRAHSATAGYDRIINGMKVEIKFSLATRAKIQKPKPTGYLALKVVQLKEILRERKLPLSGKKAILVARLEEWDIAHQVGEEKTVVPAPKPATRVDYGVTTDSFVINHVSKGKDWERLIFCGINPREEDLRLVWFTRADFAKHVENGESSCFNIQQGGKKIKNDDYMCTDIQTLMSYDWVHVGCESAFTK